MTMSHDHCREDLILTVKDFAGCGWKVVLDGVARKAYSSIWNAFSDAAKLTIDEGRQAHGKVLRLLADACSMVLSPENINEPFKPLWVMDGQRSLIPDDLSESHINFFAQIVHVIDDEPWLKGRLADLVWLKKHPRDFEFALLAIDSYRSIPLGLETSVHDGLACWQRAIRLARILRKGAGNRLAEMEAAIIEKFKLTTKEDRFLGRRLADLLKSQNLGRDHSTMIATKLESLAHEFEEANDFLNACDCFRDAVAWFRASGDAPKSTEMKVALAECYARKASARILEERSSHMEAARFYENAIQTYRDIPRAERALHRVDERIDELQVKLGESQKKSLDEMGVITSPDFDIYQLVVDARNAVRGKELVEALKAFANLHDVGNVEEMRERASEMLRDQPFLEDLLSNSIVVSRDGRVVDKRFSITSSEGAETAIYSVMVRDHGVVVALVVQGRILPALDVLHLEHRLCEADFVALARQSPIVPMGRELLFGKALFAGFNRDFITAIHLLVPQVEHMVRCLLKRAGEKTTHLDSTGIETENGLSALMDSPKAEKIFGRDMSFEIKALFCASSGPNLRNELAHGLLDDEACQSTSAVYAWWLGLKIVSHTFWNASRQGSEKSDQGEE